jgi:hypothetical protein
MRRTVTHPQEPLPARPLTAAQRTRVAIARSDLLSAREADLGAMSAASLILLVERLRNRLDDTLRLLDETQH